MSSYKDAFNEAAYAAEELARESGVPANIAKQIGEAAGNAALAEWTEQQFEAADNLRKRNKEGA